MFRCRLEKVDDWVVLSLDYGLVFMVEVEISKGVEVVFKGLVLLIDYGV